MLGTYSTNVNDFSTLLDESDLKYHFKVKVLLPLSFWHAYMLI